MTAFEVGLRSRRTRLRNCPPGLFVFDGTLCFKSEYSTNENAIAGEGGDAYVVESGEYFWGGAKSKADRGNLMVTPAHFYAPTPRTQT